MRVMQQSIWFDGGKESVCIIDQTRLPHVYHEAELNTLADAAAAIETMQVRGAPLIGVTAAYGVYLALRDDPAGLERALKRLQATRPTAVNLAWALQRMQAGLEEVPPSRRETMAFKLARLMEREDVRVCQAIGDAGADLLTVLGHGRKWGEPVNILTHCNAGGLAAVAWGTALAVVYKTAARGMPVHVWVGETRPRNQGAALTCWELARHGIPHTLIVDNAGGLMMQQGRVDVCIVGSDRCTAAGDVCNKIGTYLKALAARDNDIPFYAALPVSSIDFGLHDSAATPIEQRDGVEVSTVEGLNAAGKRVRVRIPPPDTPVCNAGFDITPARLLSGLITEQGVVPASPEGIASLKSLNEARPLSPAAMKDGDRR